MRKLVNSTPEKFPLVDHGLVFPVGFTPLGLPQPDNNKATSATDKVLPTFASIISYDMQCEHHEISCGGV